MPADSAKVLLIGIDAAEWKILKPLVAAGLMPNLRGIFDRGISGSLNSPYPLLSLLLWTTAITGKHAMKHNVLGPMEPRPDRTGLRPVFRSTRTAKAIWEILDENSIPAISINFPATHPAESRHGATISNLFALTEEPRLSSEAVWPPALGEELKKLRVGPRDIDVASILSFVPRAGEIDRKTNPHLAMIARILAHTATVHAAATWCIEHLDWRFAAVCYTGLHQFSHGFMQFHPPRLEKTSQRDFELYGKVIESAYRFHDQILGRLLQLAGEDCNVMVISDHGFHTDHLRPVSGFVSTETMLAWHRNQGVLVMAGPQVKGRGTISGATLLDVTPTILSLFDLPIGADMDGPPWADALRQRTRTDRRVTWEDARQPIATYESSAAQDAVAHLLELGYVEQPDRFAEFAIDEVERGNRLVLALAWLEAGKNPAAAIALLEPLLLSNPDRMTWRIALARAYAAAHRIDDCRRLVDEIAGQSHETAASHTAMGLLDLAARRATAALEHFRRAEQLGGKSPELYVSIGQAYLRMARWEDAQRVLQLALNLDPESAVAHEELAAALLGEATAQAAMDAARRAVELQPHQPRGHYLLGLSLMRLAENARAIEQFQLALRLDPDFIAAHRKLSDLFTSSGDSARAHEHQRLAQLAMLQKRLSRQRR